jgi:hypothetical protein
MAKKSAISEAGSFGSAAISATGAVLKSFARALDRGTGAVGQAAPAGLKPAKKKRAAPKRKAKAAKKKLTKKTASKKKPASSRRKR